MYANIGEKIKKVAVIVAIIGIICSIVIGIVLIVQAQGSGSSSYYGRSRGNDNILIFMGIATMILGSLVSWISSFFAYGFGELIVKTTEIAKNTTKTEE